MQSSTVEQIGKYASSSYRFLIKPEDTILLTVNIQEHLVAAMEKASRETFLNNSRILMKTARELGIPIIISELMPGGFGNTHQDILDLAGDAVRISKLKFSCWREGQIMAEIKKTGRKTVIVAGIEAHVCVLMSVMDLMVTGHTAVVAMDAVSSRTSCNRDAALAAMVQAGAVSYPTETIAFMLMESAGGSLFQEILRLLGWELPVMEQEKGAVNG